MCCLIFPPKIKVKYSNFAVFFQLFSLKANKIKGHNVFKQQHICFRPSHTEL